MLEAITSPTGLIEDAVHDRHLAENVINDPTSRAIATLILTVMLTPDANPQPAMGYQGVDQSRESAPVAANKLFQSPQKDNAGHDLLNDHSAMKTPTRELLDIVYKQQLMHETGLGFCQFGNWLKAGKVE